MPHHPRTVKGLQMAQLADWLDTHGVQPSHLGRYSCRAQVWMLLQIAVVRLAQYSKRSPYHVANALAATLFYLRRGFNINTPRNVHVRLGRPLDWGFRDEPLVCPRCGEVLTPDDPEPADGPGADVDVDPAGYSHQ